MMNCVIYDDLGEPVSKASEGLEGTAGDQTHPGRLSVRPSGACEDDASHQNLVDRSEPSGAMSASKVA
jgi:hypothetical protein